MAVFEKNTFNIYIQNSDDTKRIINLLRINNNLLNSNNLKITKIMAEQSQLASDIQVVTEQVAKIGAEVSVTLEKVTTLEAALDAADDVSPEVQAAFDALKAQVIAVDDLIPDVESTTTTTTEEESTTTTTTEEESTTTSTTEETTEEDPNGPRP